MKPYTKEDLQALRTLAHGSDTERHRFLATVSATIEERDRLREALRAVLDDFPDMRRHPESVENARSMLEDK